MSARWIPGAIPSTAGPGRWKHTSDASSVEIATAIARDELDARSFESNGDEQMAALYWRRWLGLHNAWIRAYANEIRVFLT